MSTKSNDQGRAYEYAWINILDKELHNYCKTKISINSSFSANQRAWNSLTPDLQKILETSAKSAINSLIELEPLLTENDGTDVILEFQKDNAGTDGDVRDIIIKKNSIKWEIGLSIKHNHEAIKHSRISHSLNFGKEWFNIPCSTLYWEEIMPVFNMLKYKKTLGEKWSNLKSKENDVYVPILDAFINEIKRANKSDPQMPKKMIEYLIGTKDYYKIVSYDSKKLTIIHTFNIHGTLNKNSKTKISKISVPKVALPTELISIRYKTNSKNTVEMYLNNGWQLSFRIHNASTYIEPSLKFDIQFMGMPVNIINIECKWNKAN